MNSRGKGNGSIYRNGSGYSADITIKGKRYYSKHKTKVSAAAYLDGIIAGSSIPAASQPIPEPFRDPYFRGLSLSAIAMLAKKSIRLTDQHIADSDAIEKLSHEMANLNESVAALNEIFEKVKGTEK